MGSGKGSPEYWVAVVKPGRVMFELEGVTEAQAKEALRLASHKLPVRCKFVVQHVTGQLDNPVKMREIRRDIARVKTIIREMEKPEA